MLRILLVLCLLSTHVQANEAADRLDPISLYSPRVTLKTFMTAMNKYLKFKKVNPARAELALTRASKTFSYEDVSTALRYEVANTAPVYLKEVLDRVLVINFSQIPNTTTENSWTIKDTAITIIRVKDGPQAGKYLFSPYTVANASDFFRRVQDLPYVVKTNQGADYRKPWIESKIPPYLKVEFMGYQRWKYIGLVFYILFGFMIKLIVTFLLTHMLKIAERSSIEWDDKVIKALSSPTIWFVSGLYYYAGTRILSFDGRWQAFIQSFLVAYIAITIVWASYNLVDIWIDYLTSVSKRRNYAIDDQLIPIIRKSVRFFVAAAGILVTLQNIGINVMSVVAGLGLGGLAFALAAKDTAANLFGSIMIFSDRPFRVGDWISFDDMEGVVEDIGLRSTRIRSFSNSLITIPNATVANVAIDNVGLRRYRRIRVDLGVTYSTTREQIVNFTSGIKEILEKNKHVKKDDYSVAFYDFADSSLNIFLSVYLHVADRAGELKVREEIFLEIMKLAESLEVSFAFPSSSVYIESDAREDKS